MERIDQVTLTVKRRELRRQTLSWRTEYFHDGYWDNAGIGTRTFLDKQITWSEGHAWPKDRGVRDAGGPFDTVKLTYRNDHGSKIFRGDYPYSIFPARSVGNSFPHVVWPVEITSKWGEAWLTDNEYLNYLQVSSSTLAERGARFISDTIPTNPMLDASVSLAELYREGLPSMIGSSLLKDRVGVFRGIAKEYLNVEFGWKPIVSDLKAAAKAIMDQESILLQLQRDSGRDVHRKRFLPTEVVQNGIQPEDGHMYQSGMQHSAFNYPSGLGWYIRQKRDSWFSGSYTYYFEPSKMSEISRIATEARLLYGLTLTPEVVWNLAPWSWLVDWIVNVGDVFHNVSAFSQDGLILRYGYVMEQNSREIVRQANSTFSPSYIGTYPANPRETFSTTRKMRRKATPFGFGLLESSFSARQWAILAALGITRAPKQLPQ